MKLFTKALLKKIPTPEQTAELGIDEQFVYCKFFNPLGNQRWYITSYDPEYNEAFGFVNLGDAQMAELGYISISELENIRLPLGMKIERDLHFEKMPLREVMDKVYAGGHV